MDKHQRLEELLRRQIRSNQDRADRAARTLGVLQPEELTGARLDTILLDLIVDTLHLGDQADVRVELEALLEKARVLYYLEIARTDRGFLDRQELPEEGGSSSPALPEDATEDEQG